MPDRLTILCVDDESHILHTLERFCRNEGFTMLSAQSADQGLALLEKNHVDAVISDYQMPQKNGLDLLREVKRQWPGTTRIMLSGCIDSSQLEQAMQHGEISAFLPKPWQRAQLKSILQAVQATPPKNRTDGDS